MRKAKKNIVILEMLNNSIRTLKEQDMAVIYDKLMLILKNTTGFKSPFDFEDMKTDRDFTEVNIEAYAFLYCLGHNMNYKNVNYMDIVRKDEFFKWLIDYKLDRFGNEIMAEAGYKITGRNEHSIYVKPIGEVKNILN